MADVSLEDNIFELLTEAKKLENTGKDDAEAATKYYEAVYLMQRFLQRLPQTSSAAPKRALFQEQINKYERIAQKLIMAPDPSPTADNRTRILRDTVSESQKNLFLDSMATIPAANVPSKADAQALINQIHRLVNKANNRLAHALDLDESSSSSSQKTALAIEAYMTAAELYLEALQAANGVQNRDVQQVTPAIKKRVKSTLDRVEQLKNPGKLDKSQPQEQRDVQTEKIPLTKEEVSVLMQSSTTVSGLFLPWSNDDAHKLSSEALRATKTASGKVFTDPAGFLSLSDMQKEKFYKFARPDEIVRIRQQSGLTRNRQQIPLLVLAISPYTIKQKYVTDCSFIASLCVTAAFERKFKKRLITSSIFPQTAAQQPFYNPLGKYMVKLWLNGVARSVVIDDYLPIDKFGNLLCGHTTGASSQHLELWVCLIEKAYMKLCGGYGFPGSNSGVDLFSLTGWVPERIHFSKSPEEVRDFEVLPERCWERVSSASSYGDCLITVSSHLNLSDGDADRLGLVMGHAYAVLSIVETSNGVRMLQLKNPWAQNGWKGRYSPFDKEGWKDPKFRAEVGYDPDKASHHDDGVFWICWDDILNYFQNFHLSWNPQLFAHRATTHGMWPKEKGPFDDTFNIGENPQYTLSLSDESVSQGATVWILISRHVDQQEQEGADVSDFLTVHVHRNSGKGETVWYPGSSGNCVYTGAYTNSPHVLARYDVTSAADKNLSLILSQYQKANDLRYTLSVYCTEKFVLSKPRADLTHCHNRSADLNKNGGPLGSEMVLHNPMFSLDVMQDDTVVELRVSTAKTIALNVVVLPVEKSGYRLDRANGPAQIDSGKYRHGFLVTERTTLGRGSYVLMVSCFTPRQKGPFQLKCLSSKPVELKTLQ